MNKPLDVKSAYNIGQAINTGIENLKKDPLWVLVGCFLFSIFQGMGNNSSFDTSALQESGFNKALFAIIMASLAFQLCFTIIGWIGGSWLRTGWFRLHQNLLGGMESGNSLFSGGDRFVDMLLWRLLVGVISVLPIAIFAAVVGGGAMLIPESLVTIGVIMAVLAGMVLILIMIYIHLGLYFGDYLVALDNKKPMDALKESWAMAIGNRFHLFLYSFVLGLFSALGFIACCIGVFATSAITSIGTTEAYLLATRGHTNITTE